MPQHTMCNLALEVPIRELFTYKYSTEKKCSSTKCNEKSDDKYHFCPHCGSKKCSYVSEQYTNIKTGEIFTEKKAIRIAGYEVYTEPNNYPDSLFFLFAYLDSQWSSMTHINMEELNEFTAQLVTDGIWEKGTFGMFEEHC